MVGLFVVQNDNSDQILVPTLLDILLSREKKRHQILTESVLASIENLYSHSTARVKVKIFKWNEVFNVQDFRT